MTNTMTRHTTEDGRYANAYDRAQEANHKAWQIAPTVYRVCSFTTKGVHYDVEVTPTGLRCSCPAGWGGMPCKHAALTSLRLQREHKSAVLSDYFDTPTSEDDWLEAIPQLPVDYSVTCPHCGYTALTGLTDCVMCGYDGEYTFVPVEAPPPTITPRPTRGGLTLLDIWG